MITQKLVKYNDENIVVGLSIEGEHMRVHNIIKILESCKDVTNINKRIMFDFRKPWIISFDYDNKRFQVYDMWDEDGTYHIQANNVESLTSSVDLSSIEMAFHGYQYTSIIDRLLRKIRFG